MWRRRTRLPGMVAGDPPGVRTFHGDLPEPVSSGLEQCRQQGRACSRGEGRKGKVQDSHQETSLLYSSDAGGPPCEGWRQLSTDWDEVKEGWSAARPTALPILSQISVCCFSECSRNSSLLHLGGHLFLFKLKKLLTSYE